MWLEIPVNVTITSKGFSEKEKEKQGYLHFLYFFFSLVLLPPVTECRLTEIYPCGIYTSTKLCRKGTFQLINEQARLID